MAKISKANPIQIRRGLEAAGLLWFVPMVTVPIQVGIEATGIIRASNVPGRDSRIPIIALTAYAMTGDREKFLAQDMDDYLSKPLSMDDLEKALARLPRKP